MSAHFLPPCVPVERLLPSVQQQGYAVLDARSVQHWAGLSAQALAALQPAWDDLPSDAYLKDGGRYRRRRHSCFVVEGDSVTQVPHRAHWQQGGRLGATQTPPPRRRTGKPVFFPWSPRRQLSNAPLPPRNGRRGRAGRSVAAVTPPRTATPPALALATEPPPPRSWRRWREGVQGFPTRF